jgi:CRP-like cAMP-binding protein
VEVSSYIFAIAIGHNKILCRSHETIDSIVKVINVEMYNPEDYIISQGDPSDMFYIISKGECEVYIKDEKQRENFVHKISTGKYFGEIGLIMNCTRTASIKTANYVTVGSLTNFDFSMICEQFPDLINNFKKTMIGYKDRRKRVIINNLKNVDYFRNLEPSVMEEIFSIAMDINYHKGEVIFEGESVPKDLFILIEGSVEIYIVQDGKEIEVDKIEGSGSVFFQNSIIDNFQIAFYLRSIEGCTMVRVSKEKLMKKKEKNI